MASEKQIKEEIQRFNSLRVLTHAYEEIASIRMKNSRDAVLTGRVFLDEINKIFEEVRISYARKVKILAKKRGSKGSERLTFLSHNGRTVAVFLSANTGLYGDIVKNTFGTFMQEVKEKGSEVTIVGRYGLSLYMQEKPDAPYTFFDLPDNNAKPEQMAEIIKHIVQYEEIHVYYGRFLNVISQKPTMFSISAEISLSEGGEITSIPYIFEPTLEGILMFFEKEIFASLFEQAVYESELAKNASRVVAMDKASENIKNYINKLNIDKLKANHRVANKKQLNSMSSLFLR